MDIPVILSPQAKEVYDYLMITALMSKQEKMLLAAILTKVEYLKQYTHYGNPLAKKLIPKEYILKYDISNLFRVELPLFWRLLYSLQHDNNSQVIFIVDILNHKSYNKKFGYRNH
jgi:hypothetical protein